MKIETSTAWLPVIDVCTYWGDLSYLTEDLREDVNVSELDSFIIEHAKNSIEELLNVDMDCFGKIKVNDLKIDRPNFYNYSGDILEFTLNFDDNAYSEFMDMCDLTDNSMYKFFQHHYGSHTGFISSMPYTEEKFCKAFAEPASETELAKAVSMFIWYLICKQMTEKDLTLIQSGFVDDVIEDVKGNTDLCDYEED